MWLDLSPREWDLGKALLKHKHLNQGVTDMRIQPVGLGRDEELQRLIPKAYVLRGSICE